jgi:L,D-transpeptidase catalytic domain/Rv2525c-like, glycoside hydrolase-like domain
MDRSAEHAREDLAMAVRPTKQKVLNRGVPPDSFLNELVAWGTTAPDEIFAPNENADVYSSVVEVLGPWQGLPHRRAAMLEVMRVLAGFESSWDWNAGVDVTNPTSTTPTTIEAGAFQVSANSMSFGQELKDLVQARVGSLDGNEFQKAMKRDHPLAMEYIARLLRRTVKHNGPVKRHEIDPWLRKDAVEEFQALLGVAPAMAGASSMSDFAAGIPVARAELAKAGMHGFDANTKLTATTAKALKDAGFSFGIRYLSRKANPPAKDLTADELNIMLDAGLAVMAVQHVAPSGWSPTDTLGVEYGANAAAHARAVGLAEESSVWLDLEGIAAGTSASDVIAYCNAWFKEVESAGYTTGVYVGANCILSGDELYLRLKTGRYWKSGSNVPDIPHRGYCMVQHIIAGDKVGGVAIDRNVTFVDAFGNAPMLMTRGPATDMAALASSPLAGPASLSAPVAFAADAPAVAAGASDEAILRGLAANHDLAAPMEALINFRNQNGGPMSARYWAIADFNIRSSEPRLFLFDVRDNDVQSYLCAHGKGSEGPTDDGYANVFSNVSGSNCTSLGIYRCAETYNGKHGFSMRLDGLESTNSNARARAVVMHAASYVSPEFIAQTGRIGRSDGCLALEDRFRTEVINALTGGSLVIAWHSNT